MSQLIEQASRLPKKSGVYLFKDAKGKVLYVGKAKNLRARVGQYLRGQDSRKHVGLMMRKAHAVEVALTETEKDAFLLENTLIKRYHPRYNVQLRDDKNFLHIALDTRQEWPRFRLVRRIDKAKGLRTFGPFVSAKQARKTLSFVERSFPVRTCSDRTLKSRKRPCLLYQMQRCVAPCMPGLVEPPDYQALIDQAALFLEGRHTELLVFLQTKMRDASNAEAFEQAGRLRDLIRSIEATLERQQVVDTTLSNRDIWGLYRSATAGVLSVIPVRAGMMLEPLSFPFKAIFQSDADLLSAALMQFYSAQPVPREILLPMDFDEMGVLSELLREEKKGALDVLVPLRGKKKRLVVLAEKNAEARFRQTEDAQARRDVALAALAKHCGLSAPPRQIECFDNSNFQGDAPVASQVVFVEGKPAKSLYRKYHIKTVEGPDDFASMTEVLDRRIRRAYKEDLFPDLIVVDGGRGQLSAAQACLSALGADHVPVIGLAKARREKRRGQVDAVDKIILPNQAEALILPDADPALNLLRHLRDESHRFAIRFHRKTRKKASMFSVLDGISGVGAARKRALLRHFGSLRALRAADLSAIAEVQGISLALAERVFSALNPDASEKN
jgi:excinuclease ABC subunit C